MLYAVYVSCSRLSKFAVGPRLSWRPPRFETRHRHTTYGRMDSSAVVCDPRVERVREHGTRPQAAPFASVPGAGHSALRSGLIQGLRRSRRGMRNFGTGTGILNSLRPLRLQVLARRSLVRVVGDGRDSAQSVRLVSARNRAAIGAPTTAKRRGGHGEPSWRMSEHERYPRRRTRSSWPSTSNCRPAATRTRHRGVTSTRRAGLLAVSRELDTVLPLASGSIDRKGSLVGRA